MQILRSSSQPITQMSPAAQYAACVRLAAVLLVTAIAIEFASRNADMPWRGRWWPSWGPWEIFGDAIWERAVQVASLWFCRLGPILPLAAAAILMARPRSAKAVLLVFFFVVYSDYFVGEWSCQVEDKYSHWLHEMGWSDPDEPYHVPAPLPLLTLWRLGIAPPLVFWCWVIAPRWRSDPVELNGVWHDLAPPMWRSFTLAFMVWLAVENLQDSVYGSIVMCKWLLGWPVNKAYGVLDFVEHASSLMVSVALIVGVVVIWLRPKSFGLILGRLTLLACIGWVLGLPDVYDTFPPAKDPAHWGSILVLGIRGARLPLMLSVVLIFHGTGARRRHLMATARIVCRRCGYIVGGTDSTRCPECGLPH